MNVKEDIRHTRIFQDGQEDLMTLREWLAHRELTQAELARLINVRREQVNKWCAGTHSPSGQHLTNICHVLDCQPHEIKALKRPLPTTTTAERVPLSQRVLSFVTTITTEMGV